MAQHVYSDKREDPPVKNWIALGGVPMTVGIVSLRHATGNEVLAKHSLELRPTRKRRREVLDPDEDEMDYPFADDLIGAPGIDPSDEAEKIPFLDLGAHGSEEFLELVAEPETPVPPQEHAQIAPVDVTKEIPFHANVPIPEELDVEEAIEEIPPPPGLQLPWIGAGN